MSNFDKMIKLIKEKDIKGMEEWLHPDFLFVVDYEMETREEWLKDTERLFGEKIITLFQTLNCCMRMKMSWFTKAGTLWKVSKLHQ